jgi:hypothetical protein
MTSTYNYGATLQAYALQEFTKGLGAQVELIEHISDSKKSKKIKLTDFSKSNLYKIPYACKLNRGYRRFHKFYAEKMSVTSFYANDKALYENPPISEVYISGSDQVFNPRDSKLNRFFLTFAPKDKVKISYAASMGDPSLPEDKKLLYKEALKDFTAISVREREAYDIISTLTEKEVSINCDPAFLLNAKEWRDLEIPVKNLKPNEYVLCYVIHNPPYLRELLRKIKKETGKKIVLLGLNGYSKIKADRHVRDAGPGEFLWLIDNAYAVVSSSFHGNVFSLIFGKRLISTPDKKRPDRINNLLRKYDEIQRIVWDSNVNLNIAPISSKKIEDIASLERDRSREYLLNAFKKVKEKNG